MHLSTCNKYTNLYCLLLSRNSSVDYFYVFSETMNWEIKSHPPPPPHIVVGTCAEVCIYSSNVSIISSLQKISLEIRSNLIMVQIFLLYVTSSRFPIVHHHFDFNLNTLCSFLRSCRALGDWESALAHFFKKLPVERQVLHLQPLELNLLISCCIKAKALHVVKDIEEQSIKDCMRFSKSCLKPDILDFKKDSQESYRAEKKLLFTWPRLNPNVRVPSDRFAKLFGSKVIPKYEENDVHSNNKEKRRSISTNERKDSPMIFFPSSSDLASLCNNLVEKGKIRKALGIMERHIVLTRLAESKMAHGGITSPPYYTVAETKTQEIDESLSIIISSCAEDVEIDRLVVLNICSGSLPLSSTALLSKLEDKKLKGRVRSVLKCADKSTKIALTNTYSALIATWVSRKH